MRGSSNFLNLFRSASYRRKHKNNDFPLFGLDLILGKFGSGKTLTVVDRVYDYVQKYPDVRIVTNVQFNDFKDSKNYYFCSNEFDFLSTLLDVLSVENEKGTIVVVDEVRGFLAETLRVVDSPRYNAFFTILSQVRKLHCVIILTSQIYSKVQKVLREYMLQNGDIVVCKKLFPGFTYYMYYDMDSVEEVSGSKLKGRFRSFNFLIHSPELYEAYDSHAVVSNIKSLLRGD